MPDRAVLAGRVGRLKDQQYGMTIGRVVKLLHRAELGDVLLEGRLLY